MYSDMKGSEKYRRPPVESWLRALVVVVCSFVSGVFATLLRE